MKNQLKALSSKNNVTIIFGEWFDKTAGNTYYDAEVMVDDQVFNVKYQYGYNAGDKQSIDEALESVGFRVRNNEKNKHKPYQCIHTTTISKLKRELFKKTEKIA